TRYGAGPTTPVKPITCVFAGRRLVWLRYLGVIWNSGGGLVREPPNAPPETGSSGPGSLLLTFVSQGDRHPWRPFEKQPLTRNQAQSEPHHPRLPSQRRWVVPVRLPARAPLPARALLPAKTQLQAKTQRPPRPQLRPKALERVK